MALRHILPIAFGIAFVAGCGGGGSGGGAGGSGSLNLFATDSPRDDYSKVWVTIHKIDLIGPSASATVYDNVQGALVDLKTLRDVSGERFLFLGKKSIDTQAYASVRVTVAKSLSVVSTGSTVTQQMTFHDSFDSAPGMSAMTFLIANGSQLGGAARDLVIDFDLSAWIVAGTVVTPVAKPSSGAGLDDPTRHEKEDYHGVIGGLSGTAPNQSFTLTMPSGSSFQVQTSAATVIFNNNGLPSPTLANSQFVEVRGTFSIGGNELMANSIKIEDGPPGVGEPEIKGPFSNQNPAAGTLTVEALEVENFVPSGTNVNIVTAASTVFRNDRGVTVTKDEFFVLLKSGIAQFVEAEGTYDAFTNTLTAHKIKVEDDFDGGGADNAEVNGVVSFLNPGAGTFSVTLGSWAGFNGTAGMVVPVQTTETTTYRNDNGDPISAASFFASLSNGNLVEAEGHFSGNVLVATKAKLDNN